jgi:hypothetical protein
MPLFALYAADEVIGRGRATTGRMHPSCCESWELEIATLPRCATVAVGDRATAGVCVPDLWRSFGVATRREAA